ncbi:amino acid adenylation domain-containing protein [Streptomyces sp. NPDC015127]|uniref:amino acid adenylation domain-containing protein n=1 Tax=Streptomyces sp. NPDC015127 TaxID=3364939 RepID=UPI0036F94DCD
MLRNSHSVESLFSVMEEGETQDFTAAVTVHDLVEQWAKQTPDAVAVTNGRESLTYAELSVRANRLAHFLTDRGASPSSRVGVWLPRGIDAVVSFLAVLKAGCAYVPLDPNYPPDRLTFISEDAELVLTITPDLLRENAETASLPCDSPTEVALCDGIAYVIYTSGSTGKPKGIEVHHSSIVDLVMCADYMEVDHTSRFLHASSISFDAAVLEIWSALLRGGQLVIAKDGPLSSEELADLLQGGITHAMLPTALFHRQAEDAPESFAGLQTVTVGGETLSADHATAVCQANPGLRLINLYGPTEVTVYCTYHVLESADGITDPVPIGRPAANARLRVLDTDLRPVAVGQVGELFVGGPCLARGYLHRPELTAERFVSDPQDARLRLYRTGDLVRWQPDGTLVFCGRVDDQIKLHGHRIEPGEIETVLRGHGAVARVRVVRREDRPGRPYLAAYITLSKGQQVTTEELRAHLARRLPAYMVPAAFQVLPALPLTANGKVDAAALPTPSRVRDAGLGPVVAPRSAVEEELVALWREILDLEEVSVHDGFVAAGGNSLAAMRIATAVGKRFEIQVPLSALLPTGNIASLAELIEHTTQDGSAKPIPIPRVARDGRLPATAGQQGLWFHDQACPGSAVYSEILPLRLRGPLQVGVLRQCIERLVARHEPLRTALVLDGERLVQRIRPVDEVVLAEVDLTGLDDDGEREAALAQAVRWGGRPFDLPQGPPARAQLIHLAEQDHLLVMSMHHAAMDGWSANILFTELAALYRALAAGEQPALEPLPVQFADFAVWQHQQLEQGGFEEEVAYWRKQLAEVPEQLLLPTDLPRPERPSGQGALARTHLSDELTARIDDLAQATGTTRYMVLLAAFRLLLARYTATDDIVVGTPASGRTHPDLERAVGYFINTLPLRTRIHAKESFTDLLARVRTTVLEAYAHQQLPFPALVQACGLETDSLTPLVQVALVPEDVYTHAFPLDNHLDATFEYHDLGIAKYDLTLALIPDNGGDGLRINAEYRTDLFQPATIDRILEHLHTVLQSATTTPDTPVGQLETLPAAERAQVCGGFDGPDRDFPYQVGVHQLVDHWAERTPDAIAITGQGTSLTYAQLVARANQLAHYLADRGADPGTHIGVQLPRSTDAVVAFLAIIKTGAAYVPLDPAYPQDRLAYMTDDAGLVLTLTPELLDRSRPAIAACPTQPLTVTTSGNDIAYVLYTSGSTGRPKGVPIRHCSIIDLVTGADYLRLDTSTRQLHAASVSFDMTTIEVWGALIHGGRLVVAPPQAMTAQELADFITRHRVTHVQMPTALFHRRMEESPTCLAGLESVMVGGETLNPAHAMTALQHNPGLRLINGYGPTEATTYATWHVLTSADQITGAIPIGRPTPNTRARVLDGQGRPVPFGVPGELYLGGPGLSPGYLNRPELTSEQFRSDPEHPSELLYRTGDLVRWLPDGTLAFHGRIDQQIKLHGYRIEPGEIEAVLHTHPGISGVHVIRRQDQPGQPYLAAYYTTVPGEELSCGELAELAAAHLPAYMVPRICVALDRFPLTGNGKVDYSALPAPKAPAASQTGEGTGSGLEEKVAVIWRNVVMADAIDLDERLFDIGGASLHAARIHQQITERFPGLPLRMIDLFTYPTVRTYSAHLRTLQARANEQKGDNA